MGQATEDVKTKNIVNGVNVDELLGTIASIKSAPVIGDFKFKASNKWINGGLNRTTINKFYGAQKELSHKEPFELDADEPPLLLGEDQGPNPVEYALTALAACVTTSIVYHAAAKGIKLKSVESKLEGDIDLRGFLGISKEVSPGYKEIRMNFKIESDAPTEQLKELIGFAPSLSPVFNTITRAVPVKVKLLD
jgi:uncharacterized OsmC-like protein